MTDLVNPRPSWSYTRAEKPLPPPPLSTPSNCTSPIPIPRRRTVHPPPCSPTRDPDSPELVFNFDFSISPDGPDMTSQILLQQRGVGMRYFPPKQKAPFTPLAALGMNRDASPHPYAQEPFLYTIPKLPLRDAQNTHVPVYADQTVDSTPIKLYAVDGLTSDEGPSAASSVSSLSSLRSSNPSAPPSADVSMHLDGDENFPLTFAFHRPLASASVTSSSISSLECTSFSASVPYRSPSPSPPHPLRSQTRTRNMAPPRPTALRRTTTAAPVVSLNVAQAERQDRGMDTRGVERSRSPCSGIVQPRMRRSSSVGADRDLEEKLQDPGRRMATVVGRGAGRVVSMFEYTVGGGRSLVSDEDIELSLEKDVERSEEMSGERGKNVSQRKREERRNKTDCRGPGSPELERGRARGRVSARDSAVTTRTRALPGWQWIDAQ